MEPPPTTPATEPERPELRLDRRQAVCAGILTLQGAFRLALLFATPSLIGRHPLLLEALRGSTSSLVAGGAFASIGRASLALALLVPLPTLMMSDPVVWWAGRLWGPSVIDLIAGQGATQRRGTRRAMRLIERARSWAVVLAPVLPVPSVVIYAAAGWTGMRLRRFLVLDLIGTFGWVVAFVTLGYALGRSAVNVAHAITHYSLLITIGLVVASIAVAVWRARRVPTAPEAPERSSD
ncbi:MAG TPA: VTT domain-containing protein [Solirubrobacteraceae bacterium]|nr:VTT domain-containing protein [Solirubrobacteraceae bacterium]